MSDRIIRNDYGYSDRVAALSTGAYLAFPFLWRACDNYGCFEMNLRKVREQAFKGRTSPNLKQLAGWMDQWTDTSGDKPPLIYVWDCGGKRYGFVVSWFQNNYFRKRTWPATPRPPLLEGFITSGEWESKDLQKLSKLFKTSDELAELISRKRKVKRKPLDLSSDYAEDPGENPKASFGTNFGNLFAYCFKGKSPNPLQEGAGLKMFKGSGWKKLREAMLAMMSGGYGWGVDGANVRKWLDGNWDKSRGGAPGKPSRDKLGTKEKVH